MLLWLLSGEWMGEGSRHSRVQLGSSVESSVSRVTAVDATTGREDVQGRMAAPEGWVLGARRRSREGGCGWGESRGLQL